MKVKVFVVNVSFVSDEFEELKSANRKKINAENHRKNATVINKNKKEYNLRNKDANKPKKDAYNKKNRIKINEKQKKY